MGKPRGVPFTFGIYDFSFNQWLSCGLERLAGPAKQEMVLKMERFLREECTQPNENLPESTTPRVETTAAAAAPAAPAAAAPPKSAAPAASTPLLDRIKKEPWIAIIGVVVLLLVL